MGRKAITPLEAVLRENVQGLLDAQYEGVPYRVKKRHKNVRLATLQDILSGKGGCTIAMLGPLAQAFGVQPYQLLIRNLDPKNPQQAISAKQMQAIKDLRGDEQK